MGTIYLPYTGTELTTILGNVDNLTSDAQTQITAINENYTRQTSFGETTGVANTYLVSTTPNPSSLVSGMAISVKINIDSNSSSTLNWNSLGAKTIKKANGTDVTTLKSGGIYTLRYDGINFILQGEGASGNATASNLLSGKTATTDVGEITGTMIDRTGDTVAISSVVSSTTLKLLATDGYRDGVNDYVTITDSDFLPSNIKNGTNLFGIVGTMIDGSGKKTIQNGAVALTDYVASTINFSFNVKTIMFSCEYSGVIYVTGTGYKRPYDSTFTSLGGYIVITQPSPTSIQVYTTYGYNFTAYYTAYEE